MISIGRQDVYKRQVQELGREPSIKEVAQALDLPVEKVSDAIRMNMEPVSLEMPIGERCV